MYMVDPKYPLTVTELEQVVGEYRRVVQYINDQICKEAVQQHVGFTMISLSDLSKLMGSKETRHLNLKYVFKQYKKAGYRVFIFKDKESDYTALEIHWYDDVNELLDDEYYTEL